MSIVDRLKKHLEAFETLYKAGSLLFTGATMAAAFIVRSHKLSIVIAASALIGGLIGFLTAAWRYAPLDSKNRNRLLRFHVVFAILSFVLVVAILALADPGLAAISTVLARIREFVLTTMLIFNVLIAVGTFVFAYAGAAAILISAPRSRSVA
jgi:uncharacterized Tic20 family protein